MWARVKQWAKVAVAVPVVLLVGSFGLETLVAAPPYTIVYVDDAAKTVLAPQCAAHYQQKTPAALLRRTTMGDADARQYKLDYDCKETGVFSQDGPSLGFELLSGIGLWPKKTYWWDQPFRTEDGVVYPGKSGPPVAVAAETDGTPAFCYPNKAGPAKFDLTPQQLDTCAAFAHRHLQAQGGGP
jgi:hypothetical protein